MLSQNTEKMGHLPETVQSSLGQTERSKQNETCVEVGSALLLSAQEPASSKLFPQTWTNGNVTKVLWMAWRMLALLTSDSNFNEKRLHFVI